MFHAVGCSHHDASLPLRERLAFGASRREAALDAFHEAYPRSEVVILSTCNRVELYVAGECPRRTRKAEIVAFLSDFHKVAPGEIAPVVVERSDAEAARHLFEVASSLDSMVVGEAQILGQVKDAYEAANERGTTGPITHAAFQTAVMVARRVTTETEIHRHRVSIPSVAVADFAARIFERFDDKKAVVLGAGEMAEETLNYLREAGIRRVVVVNRGRDRAERLAAACGGDVVAWDDRLEALADADLVVSAVGADEFIVTAEQFDRVAAARTRWPLFVLDLAVPRNFDPAAGRREGVYLYSIDDLKTACEANRRRRDKWLPAAERIVAAETARFMAGIRQRSTGPLIQRLREEWTGPKEEELRRLLNKLPDLDERAKEEICRSFDRLVNKLLHPPLESLRLESENGVPHSLMEALAKLFRLRD